MTCKLTECFIKVTALLEYLDLALKTRSWVSLHNTLAFAQIILYYCKEFLLWLLQLQINFQPNTLNSCSTTTWIFYLQIWSCGFDTGWVLSYLHGLFLDSFQTTQRHSFCVYSIYMPIFNSFLEAVYPVAVTTNQSCFMWTISHNSGNH